MRIIRARLVLGSIKLNVNPKRLQFSEIDRRQRASHFCSLRMYVGDNERCGRTLLDCSRMFAYDRHAMFPTSFAPADRDTFVDLKATSPFDEKSKAARFSFCLFARVHKPKRSGSVFIF